LESKVIIGLPVYNGEKTIHKTINSILSQTFQDFVLLISDNFSTDSTNLICKEFEKNDKRIQYVLQKKNIGWLNNFLFLLNQANSKYFVWIASDDFWEPTFLEKNIRILDSSTDIVGSVSEVGIIGDYYHKFDPCKHDNIVKKYYKKVRQHYLSLKFYGTCGTTYEKRVSSCLKSFRYALLLYSVFNTDVLKKSVNFNTHPWDWGLILIILKYGNLHLINEVLTYRSPEGISDTNSIELYHSKIVNLRQMLFPKIFFTKWFIVNIGKKIFLQNIGFFTKLNFLDLQ
jgi:glycosyltransferase involved in cell wall biosynthesis